MPSRPAALLVCLAALAGCDVFSAPETRVVVTGRVIDAVTGAPIEGVMVLIVRPGMISSIKAETRSGPDGRFAVAHDDGDYPHSFRVWINTRPQSLRPDPPEPDPRYSYVYENVLRGETLALGDVALARRADGWPTDPPPRSGGRLRSLRASPRATP